MKPRRVFKKQQLLGTASSSLCCFLSFQSSAWVQELKSSIFRVFFHFCLQTPHIRPCVPTRRSLWWEESWRGFTSFDMDKTALGPVGSFNLIMCQQCAAETLLAGKQVRK